MARTFVEVTVKHDIGGKMTPLKIHWADGRVFTVDRVLDVRMAGAMKAGGQGTRYTCRIHGKEVYLFSDWHDGKWFIEN
jgi:hypothetical protein